MPDSPRLVILSCLCPVSLNIFRLLFVDVCELVACPGLGMQERIEFGLDCLRVPVLSPLNEQGHEPGSQNGDTRPTEALAIEEEPKKPVDGDNQEREGVPSEDPEDRQ